ncbi:MAG: hypothetical protein JJE52_16580 [Acidimicrobiia bacterium]|nr:hypothetical protein [Acidimicrobiia bacterium]
MVIAADLLPWWFAGAFWVAFVSLVVVVARDVRRLGGVRHVIREVRAHLAVTRTDGDIADGDTAEGDTREPSP